MPWSTFTSTSDDLFRDVQATFLETYQGLVGRNAKLSSVMRLGVPSNKRKEFYGYFESPPTVDRIDRGESIAEDAFKAISYSVENLTWGKSIGFLEEDLDDLQLGDIRGVARGLAQRAAALPEQVFFQILQGSANASLLKAIPTAPDGAALYASTAGGSARFGVTGGNIVSGNGVSTGAVVRQDFWSAIERAMQFQDTEGEPLLQDGAADGGVTVLFNAANLEVFTEAFLQTRTLDSAAVTNTIIEGYSGQVTLWPTQRITNNDAYVFFNAYGPKAIFEQVRQAPRLIDETRENSERARRYRILSTLLDMRAGYGVNVPYSTVKIDN
mgnify:CR=1 FL=1